MVKDFIAKLTQRPGIAHTIAGYNRYNKRLGPQFAAAITYFSVLSMVPIMMFAVSMLGMTLTVLRPDWLTLIKQLIDEQLSGSEVSKSLSQVIDNAFAKWRSIGVVALLTAAYTGSNWVGNLKRAFRVMWLDKFSDASVKRSFFMEILENLLIFLGVLLCLGVAGAVTTLGGGFSEEILAWLGITNGPGAAFLMQLATILASLTASWLLFAFLFATLPGEGTKLRTWGIGTLAGAVLVTLLQQLAGVLIKLFTNNAAAALFGSVIVLMLVFNLLATIILLVGAWVGTADVWREELAKKQATDDVDIDDEDEPDPVAEQVESARTWADKRRRERWAARMEPEKLRAVNFDPGKAEALTEQQRVGQVSRRSAERATGIGLGIGYGLGAATGVGAGAALASLVGRLRKQPRDQ